MITKNQVINEYNALAKKCKSLPNINGREYLESLTDHELFVFIIAKTYIYGRKFDKCIENAKWHMENKTKAIKLFSTRTVDLLGC